MELRAYLDVLWRSKFVIAITTVLTVAVAAIGTVLTPPSYAASTTLRVTTPASRSLESVNYDTYMYGGRVLNTYAQIATSAPILEQLAQQLGVPQPPKVK